MYLLLRGVYMSYMDHHTHLYIDGHVYLNKSAQ